MCMRRMARGTLSPKLYADLIGKPYAEGARGPEAFDCLGLVLELQRRQGRPLPAYDSTPEEFARQHREGVLGPCREIAAPEPGCIVLLRMLHGERHLGTMIDPYRMLHTLRDVGRACSEGLRSPVWARRVMGYYLPEAVR
ncbi:MAG TPA: NlpC/P60 family protein [Acidobacteriaceae bacterium]|nr:NlpC/P60 family protein [Acidobacteriaceae bacterium]